MTRGRMQGTENYNSKRHMEFKELNSEERNDNEETKR
jgi:hypothetical protein